MQFLKKLILEVLHVNQRHLDSTNKMLIEK